MTNPGLVANAFSMEEGEEVAAKKRSLLSAASRRLKRPQPLQSLGLNVAVLQQPSPPLAELPTLAAAQPGTFRMDAGSPLLHAAVVNAGSPLVISPAKRVTPVQPARTFSPCSCQICGASLGLFSLAERQRHVNACLDASIAAPPQSERESGTERRVEPPSAEHIDCPLCSRNIAALTVAERVQHVDACGVDDAEGDDVFEQRPKPLSKGGLSGAREAEQGLRCQLCGLDLLRLAVAQRHAHVTSCLARAQPKPAAAGKGSRGRLANSGTHANTSTANASHCALCSMTLQGLTAKQRIAHIRTCAKASGLTQQQLQSIFAQRMHSPAIAAPLHPPAAPADATELAAPAPGRRTAMADAATLAFRGHERQARLARAAPTKPLGVEEGEERAKSMPASPLRLWRQAAISCSPAGRSDPLVAGRLARAAAEALRNSLAPAEACEPQDPPCSAAVDTGGGCWREQESGRGAQAGATDGAAAELAAGAAGELPAPAEAPPDSPRPLRAPVTTAADGATAAEGSAAAKPAGCAQPAGNAPAEAELACADTELEDNGDSDDEAERASARLGRSPARFGFAAGASCEGEDLLAAMTQDAELRAILAPRGTAAGAARAGGEHGRAAECAAPACELAVEPAPDLSVVVEWACVDVAIALCCVVRNAPFFEPAAAVPAAAAAAASGQGAAAGAPGRLLRPCDFAARGVLDAFELCLELLADGRPAAEVEEHWRCELPFGLRKLLDRAAAAQLGEDGEDAGGLHAQADAAARMRVSITQLRDVYARALSTCGYDVLPS